MSKSVDKFNLLESAKDWKSLQLYYKNITKIKEFKKEIKEMSLDSISLNVFSINVMSVIKDTVKNLKCLINRVKYNY